MSETHRIAAEGISAVVKAEGAELTSVRDADGTELLWQAGPEWPRHAPVLFPIVGRLAGDTLRHEGKEYRLTQHGFARDATFAWEERADDRAVLVLGDSEATRAVFPFAFRFTLIYRVEAAKLTVTARVENPGDTILACGVGAHPAFCWPLADGVGKADHALEFEQQETGPILSVEGGLLGAPKPDSPFRGRTLPLSEGLFSRDALVLPDVASRAVRFMARSEGGETGRAITIAWDGYRDLGVWSKPTGAPFLCIEPWFSMASPVGWDGEFTEKPGVLRLAPGDASDFTWSVSLR